MKFQIIAFDGDSKLEFTDGDSQLVNKFCSLKRNEKNSKCEAFYRQKFEEFRTDDRELFKCPYDLFCVGPIKWSENTRIASGFAIEGKDYPEELNGIVEPITKDHVQIYLDSFDKIVRENARQNYEYLESAIHDVRHLNADITAHAERLLKNMGYAENADWDKAKLNNSETDKRTLSIFCASRDISAALTLHEIAIDPRRAKDDIVPTNIHKLFYRQKQINFEKLEKKKLTLQLDNTLVCKNLTRSFALVPIILLNNSIKYAERNSTISIRFLEAGSTLKIIFSNSGPIIRHDELEKVFLKNQRGSNRTGIPGHGIGLWLASLIIHANLGSIKMDVEEKGRDISGRRTGVTTTTVRLL